MDIEYVYVYVILGYYQNENTGEISRKLVCAYREKDVAERECATLNWLIGGGFIGAEFSVIPVELVEEEVS